MPSGAAYFLIWRESMRQWLSFALAAIDSERRDIDRSACRVTLGFGRRCFLGKVLRSHSAVSAGVKEPQAQLGLKTAEPNC